jgi:phosphate:Na+ symporter
MKVMSEGLQNVAGDRMRAILGRATDNRAMGVVTGFTVTSVIQSSSATTVMMVSFVNAGLLTLMQATGIIMGANIGTTVTGWLVSLLGFKIKISAFALPAVAIGFFARFLRREMLTHWGEVLVGFGLLFLGLGFLKDALPNIKESPELAAWIHRYEASSYLMTLAVIGVGTVITMLVQSSSAVMAVTLTAAANGLIDFRTGAALVLGENIGTTITALVAAMGASRNALRAASMHTMFNLFGVLWVWLAFPAMVRLVDWLIPGDPASAAITNHLAAFHTAFNVINMALVFPFAAVLVRAANRLIPTRPPVKEKMIEPDEAFITMPDMAVSRARVETERMLRDALEMYDLSARLMRQPDLSAEEIGRKLADLEDGVNALERRINAYLVNLSRHQMPSDLSRETNALIRAVNDIERLADDCERLFKIACRGRAQGVSFSETALSELSDYADRTREMVHLLIGGLARKKDGELFRQVCGLKDALNERRGAIHDAHLVRLRDGSCEVGAGLVFLDLLNSVEKVGDYGIRIAQSISESAS